MRILVVSPFRPDATADHGGAVYLGSLLAGLSQHAELCVVGFGRPEDREPPPGMVVHSVPFLRNDQLRMLQKRRRQLRMAWSWGVLGLPLLVAKHRSAALQRLVREVRNSFRPDAAMVEFAVMAQYLDDLAGCPTVFTDHEHGQSVPPRIGPGGLGRNRDARLWDRYVKREYAKADRVQALSQTDADRLSSLLGRDVGVRPTMVPLARKPVAPEHSKPRMLFLGDYIHHPNPEAASFLAHQVLPQVRSAMPEAELWLAGPRAGPDVQALAELPGVRLLGFVADLAHLLMEVRCMVAPVFSGSGVRIKVLTAAAHGLPVVSNALGVQGTGLPAAATSLGETAGELAAACLQMLQDPQAAAAAGALARSWAEANLGAAGAIGQQLQVLEELVAGGTGS